MSRHQFFLLQNRQFLAYILYTNIKLTFYLTSTLLRSCFFFWSIFTYTWRNVWQGQIRRSAFSFLKIYISICNRFNRMNILHLLKLLKKKVHIFNTKLITDKDMVNRKEVNIFCAKSPIKSIDWRVQLFLGCSWIIQRLRVFMFTN